MSGIKKRTEADRERMTKAARRLRDMGLSYNAIGRQLAISETSIREWLNPEIVEQRKQANGVGVKIHQGVGVSKPEPKKESGRSQDTARQVIELKARGYGNQAIAAQLRIPYRQVEEALR